MPLFVLVKLEKCTMKSLKMVFISSALLLSQIEFHSARFNSSNLVHTSNFAAIKIACKFSVLKQFRTKLLKMKMLPPQLHQVTNWKISKIFFFIIIAIVQYDSLQSVSSKKKSINFLPIFNSPLALFEIRLFDAIAFLITTFFSSSKNFSTASGELCHLNDEFLITPLSAWSLGGQNLVLWRFRRNWVTIHRNRTIFDLR